MRVISALLIVTNYLVVVKSYLHAELLGDVHKCSRYQPNLEICILRSIESMKPYLKKGFLDIPSIDEYYGLERYGFEWKIPLYDFYPLRGHMLLTKLRFSGLSDYRINRVTASPDMTYIQFQAYFPLIKLNAVYDTDATIGKPVRGPDFFVEQSEKIMYANFTDVLATITIVGNYYYTEYMEYFQSFMVTVHFNVPSYNTIFTQLDENPEISNIRNVNMCKLFQLVEEQLKSAFQVDAAKMMNDYMNKIYARFSTDTLMPAIS